MLKVRLIYLRIDSSQGGPFLVFVDHFQSFQDTITYLISSERLYFSLSIDIHHITTMYVE